MKSLHSYLAVYCSQQKYTIDKVTNVCPDSIFTIPLGKPFNITTTDDKILYNNDRLGLIHQSNINVVKELEDNVVDLDPSLIHHNTMFSLEQRHHDLIQAKLAAGQSSQNLSFLTDNLYYFIVIATVTFVIIGLCVYRVHMVHSSGDNNPSGLHWLQWYNQGVVAFLESGGQLHG